MQKKNLVEKNFQGQFLFLNLSSSCDKSSFIEDQVLNIQSCKRFLLVSKRENIYPCGLQWYAFTFLLEISNTVFSHEHENVSSAQPNSSLITFRICFFPFASSLSFLP